MNTTIALDWLRFSIVHGYGPADIFGKELSDLRVSSYQPQTMYPLKRYDAALALTPAGRFDKSTNPAQGGLVTFTGSDLQVLRQMGVDMRVVCGKIADYVGAKATRVDLACDIFDAGATARQFLGALERGGANTRAAKYTHIESVSAGGSCGMTVSVGSRSSVRYLRVYDKGIKERIENNPPEDWLRVELELKGDYAIEACRAVEQHGAAATMAAIVGDFIRVDGVEWWAGMFADIAERAEIRKPGRKQTTKKDEWLYGVALPKVIEAMECGDAVVISAIKQALAEGHCP